MGYIDSKTIDEIKSRLSIVDVISDYVKLKNSGKNMIGLCPFHMEKTPSFFVNNEKGVYHCFGCGESGNMFTFISKIENTTFPESIKILAKKANVEVKYKQGKAQEQYKEKELIYKVNSRAQFIYSFYLLNKDEGKTAMAYLHDRGISKEVVEEFKLGWSPATGNKLYNTLKKENYSEVIMSKAGLVLKSNKDNSYFDRFRGRLMFPIFDTMDNNIGFGGRIIRDISNAPKYLNTPETEVFSKRRNLYGINIARDFIRDKKSAIIVEGYFDVISLHQAGIKNVVAPLGTALTEEQVLLLGRYAEEIVLVFDSDTAGSAATIRSISLLLKTNLHIKIGQLPSNEDPDSFVKKNGREEFLKVIDNSPSFLKFIITTAFRKYNKKSSDGKNNILKFVFPILTLISNEILKNDVLHFFSEKLGVKEDIIINEFHKFQKMGRYNELKFNKREKIKITTVQKAEQAIAIILLKIPRLYHSVIDVLPVKYFSDNLARFVLEYIGGQLNTGSNKIDVSDMLNSISNEDVRNFIAAELMNEKYEKDIEKQLNDYIFKIQTNIINSKVEEYNNILKEEKDYNKIKDIEARVQNLFLKKKKILENKNKLFKIESNERTIE